MIVEQSNQVIEEVSKVLMGKNEVVEKTLMAVYAGGHILLEDVPGVGKTTLALALSKAMDLSCKRIQFTPDTMPSDITGFTMYHKQTDSFQFHSGAVDCNLLLGDEINRTSAKTQSALLEVMEERSVTVDGVTHPVPHPFVCIATQNPVGSAGTQPLPDSQLDRFMVRLSVGYPSKEDQANIVRSRRHVNPLDTVRAVVSRTDLIDMQNYLDSVMVSDELLNYCIDLCEATRQHELVELGVSPRGVLALVRMMRACAVLHDRDYAVPEDAREVFDCTCAHRLVLRPQARIEGMSDHDILADVVAKVPSPSMGDSSSFARHARH